MLTRTCSHSICPDKWGWWDILRQHRRFWMCIGVQHRGRWELGPTGSRSEWEVEVTGVRLSVCRLNILQKRNSITRLFSILHRYGWNSTQVYTLTEWGWDEVRSKSQQTRSTPSVDSFLLVYEQLLSSNKPNARIVKSTFSTIK